MTSFINLMANDVWSDADILNRMRSMTNSVASVERQADLRTIFLGHLSRKRVATAPELAEIEQVQAASEASGAAVVQSRLDMILLNKVLALESGLLALEIPEVSMDDSEEYTLYMAELAAARAAQQALRDAAEPATAALYALRNPPPVVLEAAV